MTTTTAKPSDGLQQGQKKRSRDASSLSSKPQERQRKKQKSISEIPTEQKQDQPAKTAELSDINPAWAKLAPTSTAARFTERLAKTHTSLSTIELDDLDLPVQSIQDTSSFAPQRTLPSLPEFLEQNTPNGSVELKESSSEQGCPHTLILSLSAIRSMHVKRAVDKYGTSESKIAKLFSKHIKYDEAVSYLEKTRVGIGVGTAGRIEELIVGKDGKKGVLKLEALKRVILDVSYLDEKKRGLIEDIPAFKALVTLLNVEELKLRFAKGETKILFF
ncbi:hypothetical protein BT93_L0645 [Corymbia citriodora subsp. variegata]|uniref:Uncharacterized protein n=1 Tax=Corymbia citriodora subsp. variegata TaxID=360336 RepID=A0A8T0CEJ0_CORYI|nr:hypothetical protein BT93_L0645 [Corymbia citriodora subsp. variegata]